MAYLVEVPTEDGTIISLSVEEIDEGVVRAARPGRVVARASKTLEEMIGALRPVAEGFVAQFRRLADPPDQITIAFGVTMSAGADVVVATAATDANFAVTLSWQQGK